MADHVGQRDGRIFVGGIPVTSESHRSDARGVNHAPDAVLARRFENSARALDVGTVHFVRIAHPEAVIGGDVKYGVAAGDGFVERGRSAEVAGGGFGVESFEIFQIAGRAYKQAELCALARQDASNVGAEESRSASYEDLQEKFSRAG